MEKYSVNGKLSATEGNGQNLLKILLEAAEEIKKVDTCFCYIVGMSADEKDSVYVYEVWESKDAHQASLQLDVVKKLIEKAMPIIESMTSYPELVIYGGKASL